MSYNMSEILILLWFTTIYWSPAAIHVKHGIIYIQCDAYVYSYLLWIMIILTSMTFVDYIKINSSDLVVFLKA